MEAVVEERKTIREGVQSFAELMDEVAQLEEKQQEKLTYFVQGFVAAAAATSRKTTGAAE